MKVNASTTAQQAARWLQQHAKAKVTICIAADVELTGADAQHVVVGSTAPTPRLVSLVLAGVVKKIEAQLAAASPATIPMGGRRKGRRW
jgi:hypothetical protein